MSRATVDYGIDLGTTNSSIAVLEGNDIQVIRNENSEWTPSTVWIDKRGQLFTGQAAYARLEDDPENAFGEFKLQMGTDNIYTFARSGKKMRPEDLSAEVLKSLKASAFQTKKENIEAAVITVPAAFELPQCEATQRARELAGLKQSPLLQEPVAAAMAYGSQTKSNKVFWLVYDFGGGTFDSAVVSIRDGIIQVVNHEGDNQLGGKLIDWGIVTELMVPALLKDRKLTDFRRGNPKWRGAFAKLKRSAEIGKIRVSNDKSASIWIEYLCNDDNGDPVEFDYELHRADVEAIMEPLVLRSINICKRALTEKRLVAANIEKVLLVGGPTQAPFLRAQLADVKQGLGIPLDFSIDPMTAVARGAALFAGTQRTTETTVHIATGEFGLDLDYKPVGADTEPMIGGRILTAEVRTFSGFTIEFINTEVRPPWRSGKVGLSPEGTFVTTLWAEKGRQNIFRVELRDSTGTLQKTNVESISYRIDVVMTDPPLIHTVGVALANNEMFPFVAKGTALPAHKREILRTALDVRRGESAVLLRIPVVEGENKSRADRNRLIGAIEVNPSDIKRDVPAGSEIELTIDIDASRIVKTKAFIPILDQEIERVLNLTMQLPSADDLQKSVEAEKKRLAEVREKARTTGEKRAQQALQRVDGEQMIHEVDTALSAAQDDPDAADKCGKRLLDLKQTIDEAEDALEWPLLVSDANQQIEYGREIASKYGKPEDRELAATLEREIKKTIQLSDADLLRRKVSELTGLRLRILRELPGYWVGLLEDLQDYKAKMTDQQQAGQLFNMGQRAIQSNDVPALQSAVRQLFALLPDEDQRNVPGYKSTVLVG